ncbi:hypothetical protein Hypma_014140 [Hypsizygus marmoreus]|uniref:Uncharacterized protein n=1 Tax=Hypsizygus marmoreus TaxID=39966 RepID=A0A369KBI2_HYPMA|nr:hypothetical protein Hypma_014140 [Hypsizygus marmoreus]
MVAISDRPTLPPLHSLGLPNPPVWMAQDLNALYDSPYEHSSCPHLHIPRWPRARNVSTSSSTTSRSDSPALSEFSAATPSTRPSTPGDDVVCPSTPVLSISPFSPTPATFRPSPYLPGERFRLEPCKLEDAQAIIVHPPPTAPFIPSPTNPTPPPSKNAGPLLIVGPLLQHFRHPQRPLTKGARVRPYRIVPSRRSAGSLDRRLV